MVVIKVFLFNFEHVKGERKFNFDINNINMFFKQNKIIFINKIQSLSISMLLKLFYVLHSCFKLFTWLCSLTYIFFNKKIII